MRTPQLPGRAEFPETAHLGVALVRAFATASVPLVRVYASGYIRSFVDVEHRDPQPLDKFNDDAEGAGPTPRVTVDWPRADGGPDARRAGEPGQQSSPVAATARRYGSPYQTPYNGSKHAVVGD